MTDHRVGLTLYKLGDVLSGEALGELVEALVLEGRRQRIAGMATLGDGAEG